MGVDFPIKISVNRKASSKCANLAVKSNNVVNLFAKKTTNITYGR